MFPNFVATLERFLDVEHINITIALQSVIAHWKIANPSSSLHVFLGIDEIARTQENEKIAQILSELGFCLDSQVSQSCNLFSCLVTSLETFPMFYDIRAFC